MSGRVLLEPCTQSMPDYTRDYRSRSRYSISSYSESWQAIDSFFEVIETKIFSLRRKPRKPSFICERERASLAAARVQAFYSTWPQISQNSVSLSIYCIAVHTNILPIAFHLPPSSISGIRLR